MQAVDHSGVFGPIMEYSPEEMGKLLKKNDRVEVFEGTPENLEKRQKMVGKKFKVSRSYQKASRIQKKK